MMYTANFTSRLKLNNAQDYGSTASLHVRLAECSQNLSATNHNCPTNRMANNISIDEISRSISRRINTLAEQTNLSQKDYDMIDKYQKLSSIISIIDDDINFTHLTCDNNPNANSQAFITLFSKIADEEIGFSLDSKSYTNLVQGIADLDTKTRIQASSVISQKTSPPITLSFNMCINKLTDEQHECSNILTSIFTTKDKINRYLDNLIIKKIIENPEQFNREEVIIKENDLNKLKNSSIDSNKKHEIAQYILNTLKFNGDLPKISSQIVEILQNTFHLSSQEDAKRLKSGIEKIGNNIHYTNFVCSDTNVEEDFINLNKFLEFEQVEMSVDKNPINSIW